VKGVIFTHLQEMVETQMGFQMWNDVIDGCALATDGVFISTEFYPDEELFAIVSALSEKTAVPANDLVEAFGVYLFPKLHASVPPEVFEPKTMWEMLEGLDSIIHMEVKKLNKEAETPSIVVKSSSENEMVLEYRSAKKLCWLALGMLKSAAEVFQEDMTISMPLDMHEGEDHCQLVVTRNV
jgi:hypothetical protein